MKALINNPVFRWIAVIPGAFLAVFAAMFPWHWLVLFYAHFVGRPEGEEVLGLSFLVRLIGPESIERAGYGFLAPFVLISVAAKIAPRFKNPTGVAFSSFVILIWSYIWLFYADVLAGQGWEIDPIPSLVATFLAGVGIWIAWKYARTWWDR
jgi:hypothetical protein